MTVATRLRALIPALSPSTVVRGETVVQTTIHRSGLAHNLNQAYTALSNGKLGWNGVLGETPAAQMLTKRHATVAMKGKCWCVHVEAAGDDPEGDILVQFDSDIGSEGPECKLCVRTSAHGSVFELAYQLSAGMVTYWAR